MQGMCGLRLFRRKGLGLGHDDVASSSPPPWIAGVKVRRNSARRQSEHRAGSGTAESVSEIKPKRTSEHAYAGSSNSSSHRCAPNRTMVHRSGAAADRQSSQWCPW